jgi:tetratricopeptide (TPR) repeat protein
VQRYLEHLREVAAAEPQRLQIVNEIASMTILAGQDDAALKIVDDALAKARPAGGEKPAYTDMDQLIWTLNYRSSALYDLGRYAEAAAPMEEAAEKPEDGGENVSQMINLAEFYADVGRPADALRVIAKVADRPMSPYGTMQVVDVRAMAYAQLGDKAGFAKALDYAKAHAEDAPDTLVRILLYANDLDGAAKAYIRRLGDPDQRTTALMALQIWRLPPGISPFERELERRRGEVLDRPYVQAAINEVGRVERYDIYAPPF